MQNKSRAFTLIELLVVVLIIGILAAIAVPQYQKAVYKARATELLLIGRSIQRAQQIYYMANGKYATDLTELDIQMPCTVGTENNGDTNVISSLVCPHIYGYVYGGMASLYLIGEKSGFRINFDYNGSAQCVEPSNFIAKGLCSTLGATYTNDGDNGDKVYKF